MVGVEPEHISNLERGMKGPSVSILIDIANALDTTPNELLCDYIHNEVIQDYVFYDPNLEEMYRTINVDQRRDLLDLVQTHLAGLLYLKDK